MASHDGEHAGMGGPREVSAGRDALGPDVRGGIPGGVAGGAAGYAIEFSVPGKPVGKGRPIAGRSFGGHITLRTPGKTVNYENLVGWTAAQEMRGKPLIEAAVELWLAVAVEVPASWSKVKRERALAGTEKPATKPDLDNIVKAICDALNGVVWKDDVQVVCLSVAKRYAAAPGVTVKVALA